MWFRRRSRSICRLSSGFAGRSSALSFNSSTTPVGSQAIILATFRQGGGILAATRVCDCVRTIVTEFIIKYCCIYIQNNSKLARLPIVNGLTLSATLDYRLCCNLYIQKLPFHLADRFFTKSFFDQKNFSFELLPRLIEIEWEPFLATVPTNFIKTMNIKIQFLANGDEKTWTLKPTRDYVVGTSIGDDIVLTNSAMKFQLKFTYLQDAEMWLVSNLSGQAQITINDRSFSEYRFAALTKINLDRGLVLNIFPEGISPTELPGWSGSQGGGSATGQTVINTTTPTLKKLTWAEYVERCVEMYGADRFSLVSGYRLTPWVRDVGSSNFGSFDGYVIPDFQKKSGDQKASDSVFASVQNKLSEMSVSPSREFQEYSDTDCSVVSLTDAHIIDSSTRNFLWSWFWVEFFPVKRGIPKRRPDYRDFCVVAFNRVKTYLLVENYGSDLFVSWITRYEPTSLAVQITKILLAMISLLPLLMPTAIYYTINYSGNIRSDLLSSFGTLIFLLLTTYMIVVEFMRPKGRLVMVISSAILVLLSFSIAIYSEEGFSILLVAMIPAFSWMSFYWIAPDLLVTFRMMPKRANTNFLSVVIIFGMILLILIIFSGKFSSSINPIILFLIYLVGGGIVTIVTQLLILFFIVSLLSASKIPPLDLMDAKKLDDAVSKQVESVLKPMLEKNNYTNEQIGEILTRTSLGKIQFRR
jgi:hypothetical protein